MYLYYFSPFNDLPAVEDRRAVQRVIGSSGHDVGPLRIRQVPEPEKQITYSCLYVSGSFRVMVQYLLLLLF